MTNPIKPVSVDELLERLMDQTRSDLDTLDKLEDLVTRVQILVHRQKETIVRKITRAMADAREQHLKTAVAAYRGRTVYYFTLGTGALHLTASLTGLAPAGFYNRATELNHLTSQVTGGRITALFDLSRYSASNPEHVIQVAGHINQFLGGLARASETGQTVTRDSQSSTTTEQNARSESAKLDKQNGDQEAQTATQQIDASRQKKDELERARHEALLAMLR